MFGNRYFGLHAFGHRFWGQGSSTPPVSLELEAAIAAAILADGTLSALIDSCTPGHIPQTVTQPAIWYRVSDWKKGINLDGADGVGVATLEIAAVSPNYSDVTTIGKRLITMFHGFQGFLSGIEIMGGIQAIARDQYSDSKDGSDCGPFARVVSIHFHHRDPA